jgi:precorrin-6B methylase 2
MKSPDGSDTATPPAPGEAVRIQLAGLGEITLELAHGVMVTPATMVTLQAIADHRRKLHGVVMDWGSGSGALAIAAARIPSVKRVVALELSADAVSVAERNADANAVADKVAVVRSDGFEPVDPSHRRMVETLQGAVDAIVSNPPPSIGDDGFEWRRRVMSGAVEYLEPGGLVLLQISRQYNPERVDRLLSEIDGYESDGVVASSEWVPMDMRRADFARLLEDMVAEEARGGPMYRFGDPEDPEGGDISATQASRRHREDGIEPLTQWQVHRFRFIGR